jgi:hypothetical protein
MQQDPGGAGVTCSIGQRFGGNPIDRDFHRCGQRGQFIGFDDNRGAGTGEPGRQFA